MIGHMLGAAGAVEAVVCVVPSATDRSTDDQLRDPDPDCDLDYVPNVAREVTVRPRCPTRSASAATTRRSFSRAYP